MPPRTTLRACRLAPPYCALLGPYTSQSTPGQTLDLGEYIANLNHKGKLCHPVESPYFSFVREPSPTNPEDTNARRRGTLEDCSQKGYDLPDVMRRACIAPASDRQDALNAVAREANSVKAFMQKTHLAFGLQTSWAPEHRTKPVVLLHTVWGSVASTRNANELYSWTYGPYVAWSPDYSFGRSTSTPADMPLPANGSSSTQGDITPPGDAQIQNAQPSTPSSADDSESATLGIGFLLSKRPSFDKRGFSIGVGYWRGGNHQGVQAIISTNLTSFPGWEDD